jgi:beta-glucosidase
VGSRWFDKQNLPVSYPFGYGLSYTTFEYSAPAVSNDGKTVTAKVTVKNTGSVAGKEAVQVYVSAPAGKLDKPVKELKGFAKTRKLAPGESQTVEVCFAAADMSSWDESKPGWLLDPGTYNILVGASSADIRATASVDVK